MELPRRTELTRKELLECVGSELIVYSEYRAMTPTSSVVMRRGSSPVKIARSDYLEVDGMRLFAYRTTVPVKILHTPKTTGLEDHMREIIDQHMRKLVTKRELGLTDQELSEIGRNLLKLAFGSGPRAARKAWVATFDPAIFCQGLSCDHKTTKGSKCQSVVCAHVQIRDRTDHQYFVHLCGSENGRGKRQQGPPHETTLKPGALIWRVPLSAPRSVR